MAKLTIDNKEYEVSDGNNLLHACLSLGLNLPYFCWHPCMGSIGACRQCAVKVFQDENDERGRLVMACMTPAADGTRLSIEDPQAKDFRAGIIELLMTNHPHDCPVCEEGGECHLQDMTEMSGHTFRDYRNTKRTHRNQYLGPFINHEMNRCIACYRCVRYYQDYAGGSDLQAMGAHNHVYFGRHSDGVLESPFSGNLVEVCPTGVFTDKTFSQHFTRKWDLQTAPSICQHCALGCNTSPAERYGRLKRITNRYHSAINGYFLCDRGRFGYGFVNMESRLTQCLQQQTPIKGQDPAPTATHNKQPCESSAALEHLTELVHDRGTIAIGSSRASLESNFALQQAVGEENFYSGYTPQEDTVIRHIVHQYRHPAIAPAALQTVETCDAVLVLGEDLINTAPLLALSIRQSVRQKAHKLAAEARIPTWQDAAVRELAQQDRSPLFILHPTTTDLDAIATACCHLAPDAIADFAHALADRICDNPSTGSGVNEQYPALLGTIAEQLLNAERPLVVAGSSLFNKALINAASAVAQALYEKKQQPINVHFTLPECNSMGLALLTEQQPAQSLSAALSRIQQGKANNLIVLENDLYRRCGRNRLEQSLDKLHTLAVLDHSGQESCYRADLVLPAASFAETDGTLVNSEGRAQRFFAVYPSDPTLTQSQPSWQWLNQALANRWQNFDAITQACADYHKTLQAIADVAPGADFRSAGLKVPRMSHRCSGRTAINADRHVSEPKQPQDPQTPLGFTMEGNSAQLPPSLRPGTWAPGWNSNQSIHKFQDEVGGALTGGPSGVCLLEQGGHSAISPRAASSPASKSASPQSASADQGLCPFPLYHIFGSEELSANAAPIRERTPHSYIALSPADAATLDLESGDGAEFSIDDYQFCLAVKIYPELAPGLVGLPMGLSLDKGQLNPSHLIHPLHLRKSTSWQRPADNGNLIASDGVTSP